MSSILEDLRVKMETAAEAMDFEEAARLRDRISLLRGQPDTDSFDAGEIDTSRLTRQRPGRMGLGTSEQVVEPPPGWKPPPKPSPMTGATRLAKHRGP